MYWNKLLSPKRHRTEPTVAKSAHDNRSEFKKDFDTVCNSTMLRRLQDKAQVFPLESEDYARTRLTHSIETMSIAESLGMQALTVIKSEEKKKYWNTDTSDESERNTLYLINDIPMILKTVALLHDMGNPPFGHLGEQIIGDWFQTNFQKLVFTSDKKLNFQSSGEASRYLGTILSKPYKSDFIYFDGNAQLFRSVNRLNYIVDGNGMNLTYPVMAAFIKYPIPSHEIDISEPLHKKMGYFQSEKTIYETISNELELSGYRHPLAFLLEAADDIAYLTADIEDAQRKGLISLNTIYRALEEEQGDPLIKKVISYMKIFEENALSLGYPDLESYVTHRTRVLIKGLMIDSVYSAFASTYDDIMEQNFSGELIKKSSASTISRILQEIEQKNIYYSDQILKNKTRAFAVIDKLLSTYVPAVINWNHNVDSEKDTSNNLLYQTLSKNYRFVCEQAISAGHISEEEMIYNKLLLVTDQISGMTDTHALSVYHTITAS